MKLLFAFIVAMILPVSALAADASGDAVDAAKSWLALVDAGNYAQSWSQASTLFQTRTTAAQWEAAAKGVRDTMGAVVSRDTEGVKFGTNLPGAPDGQYAIVRFDTKFAAKAAAVETVILMMDGGAWKAAGYYIK